MKETSDKARTSPEHSLSSQRGGATIALFGEVLADVFPERSVLGGAPFNVARHLRAFGQNPVLITRTGQDALRESLLEKMAAWDMETMGVQCDQNYPTGQVQVHMEGGAHRFEILPEQAYDHIHAATARELALSTHPELIYFGTLAQRHAVSRDALKMVLRHSSVPTFFDLNLRAPWYDEEILQDSLRQADTVKLNNEELAILTGMFALPGDSMVGQARSFMQAFDIGCVLVTCGAEGACLMQQDGSEVSMKPSGEEVKVVDTVGAGDGFSAVFILGKLQGWSSELTLSRAHEFAAAICTLRGAIPDHEDFYVPFLKAWQS